MTHGGDYQPEASVAADQLLSIIERMEDLNTQASAINSDKKDLMAEARSQGFDTVAIKEIVKLRADPDKYEQKQASVDLYKTALGVR